MHKYRISFNGRSKGAIGITYPISVLVETEDDIPTAVLKLYDTYENVNDPRVLVFDDAEGRFHPAVYNRDGKQVA